MNKFISLTFAFCLMLIALPLMLIAVVGIVIGFVLRFTALMSDAPLKLLQLIEKQIKKEVNYITKEEE